MWPVVMISIMLNVVSHATPPPTSPPSPEKQIIRLIENVRATQHLQRLTPDFALTQSARRQARLMASRGEIFHQKPLHNFVPGWWQELGEDVGMASSAEEVFAMFMLSPGHRALILDPTFREIGAGVSLRDGTMWISVKFGTRVSDS